jgi:hypothetical protein
VLIAKISEKDWRQQIVTLCKLLGYDVYFTWNSRHSPAGFPDIVAVNPIKKRLIVSELKVGKAKLTPFQEKWIQHFKDCGIEAYIWRPSQWEEIVECLKK